MSSVDISRLKSHTWKVNTRAYTGVNVYLDRVFGDYTRPKIRTNNNQLRFGLACGRRFHADVFRVVRKTLKLQTPTARTPKHMLRLICYFKFLQKLNLRPQLAEFPFVCTHTRVKTKIDLVCTLPDGTLVLIENKTTQHMYTDYVRLYKSTPSTKLVNGLHNSEYSRHQLQIGVALHAITANIQTTQTPRAAVIVCCRDRLGVFWTPASLALTNNYPSHINV